MSYELKSSDRKAPKVRLNATMYAMAMEEMVQGPTTRAELVAHTGLNPHTVQSVIRALHQRKIIYIAGWERDASGKASIAAFAFGSKADAPKPRPKTPNEHRRSYLERKRHAATRQATAGGIGWVSA